MPADVHRKLTTILAADAVGYSRLMQSDERRTYGLLQSAFAVFEKLIDRHSGRIVDTAGDGLIAEFPSVVEAVQCAVEVQQDLAPAPRDRGEPLQFRIGVHLGDVMVDGEKLVGEAVNLSARLQSMAKPGGILISRQVYDQVHSKLSIGFDYVGEKRPKNFSEDVSVYEVTTGRPSGMFSLGRKPAEPANDTPPPPIPPDLDSRIVLRAQRTGLILAALLLIDLITGAGFWWHWPALALMTALGYSAAPLLASPRMSTFMIRASLLAGALVLINIFSWSGTFWAIWPIGALVFLILYSRSGQPRT